MLQSIIDHFAGNNECGINLSKGGRTAACVKYSELDNILLGLEAGEVMPNFKAHNVDLQEFLQLGETDLVEIGVHQVGLRKKMMDAIAEMHKRQWEKSSLPRITPKEKQKGIYLTAPGKDSR
jgi:ankyrin repeat/SAM/basic leucine zipper domain-containing protein 1